MVKVTFIIDNWEIRIEIPIKLLIISIFNDVIFLFSFNIMLNDMGLKQLAFYDSKYNLCVYISIEFNKYRL